MSDELLRLVVGLPVALLWPRGLPPVAARRPAAVAVSALTAALVLAPVFPDAESWVLLALTAAAAVLLPSGAGAGARGGQSSAARLVAPGRLSSAARAWWRQAALAAALVALAAVLVDPDAARDALRDGAESDHLLFVLAGVLAATFVAGEAIGVALGGLSQRVRDAGEPNGLLAAGRAIGWLERVLVFTFLVAGEPAAAALALTAKSVARFPAFSRQEEPLAEYVLIGTLLSFGLATLIAIGTRALLGLSVL